MHKLSSSLALVVMTLFQPQVAAASIVTFTFEFDSGPAGISLSGGQIQAVETAPGSGIYEIGGLTGSMSIPFGQNVNYALAPELTAPRYINAGNLIYTGQSFLTDFDGFAFDAIGVGQYAIYHTGGLNVGEFDCGPVDYCIFGTAETSQNPVIVGVGAFPLVSLTITPLSETPLPATFPLFATGLGALGLLGWRRKWKQAA